MKTTKVLTITKLYDFELEAWTAHGSSFVTISGEAVDQEGTTFCWTNNAKADNEERRKTDLSNLIECEAQYFVHDEGKKTQKGMRKLKITGYPDGPGQDSEGLGVLSGQVGTRTVSGGSIPPAQTGRPAVAVEAGGSISPAPARHTALLAAATFYSNSAEMLEDDVLLLAGRWERWLVGEKTHLGSGAGSEESSGVSEQSEPEPSGWGGAAPPQSDPPDEVEEMWQEAMEQFGAGNRAPVMAALRKMLDHPVDAAAVTVQDLADVIVWKQKNP